jgi:hypothetical protein
VVRNGLVVLTRDGDWHVVMEDPREDALATFGAEPPGFLLGQHHQRQAAPADGSPGFTRPPSGQQDLNDRA